MNVFVNFMNQYVQMIKTLWWVPATGCVYGFFLYFLEDIPVTDFIIYRAVPGTLILGLVLPFGLTLLMFWFEDSRD